MTAETGSTNWNDFSTPNEDDNSSNNKNNINFEQSGTKKLGIDIGRMLDPMSPNEAAELKTAATEIITDAIASGLDDIAALRSQLNTDIQNQVVRRAAASAANAQQAESQLLDKIDALTSQFRDSTADARSSTQLAAAADQASAGAGVELGAWGVLGTQTVLATSSSSPSTGSSLLGSTNAAQHKHQKQQQEDSSHTSTPTNGGGEGIIVLADVASDPYAKQLLEPLTAALRQQFLPLVLPVTIYKPTATIPLGGDNAAAVLLFCTSFSDPSSVQMVLDRLLRKTLQVGGAVGQPPTQLVAISTLGTCRLEKVPYSFQNVMGGKLAKRRQMEEAVIRTTRDATRNGDAALDFTICHLGELKSDTKDSFQLRPGDSVDGVLAVDTAVAVLTQAICLQPAARNATFSCVGKLTMDEESTAVLDDSFMRLDGPELLRFDLADTDKDYNQVVEYVKEWAKLLAETGKGLTTPIRAEMPSTSKPVIGVTRQSTAQLLFLPTATGKNYLSKEDERKISAESGSKSDANPPVVRNMKTSKDGGIEFVVEVTSNNNLRVRAKRCSYGNDVIIKELSEETILSNFRKSIEVWKKDHKKGE